MKAIIGKKLGMSRIFDEKGNVTPVTLVMVAKNIVTQVKTMQKDGYDAKQVALVEKTKINQPQKGHLAPSKITSRTLKEFKDLGELKVGESLDLSQFEKGDKVTVRSVSKGKGFSGTVKRHHFHTGPKTHGSDNYRQPGSIGSMYPQRVIKGRRMAGHMGHDQVTVKNIIVADINQDKEQILLGGAVPGAKNSTIYIWKE